MPKNRDDFAFDLHSQIVFPLAFFHSMLEYLSSPASPFSVFALRILIHLYVFQISNSALASAPYLRAFTNFHRYGFELPACFHARKPHCSFSELAKSCLSVSGNYLVNLTSAVYPLQSRLDGTNGQGCYIAIESIYPTQYFRTGDQSNWSKSVVLERVLWIVVSPIFFPLSPSLFYRFPFRSKNLLSQSCGSSRGGPHPSSRYH